MSKPDIVRVTTSYEKAVAVIRQTIAGAQLYDSEGEPYELHKLPEWIANALDAAGYLDAKDY